MHALIVLHELGDSLMKALHHQGQPDDDGRLAAGGEQQPREEEKDDVFDGIGERVGVVGGCGRGAVLVRGLRAVERRWARRGESWGGAGHYGCDGVVWR
jgi:hypothetical protein